MTHLSRRSLTKSAAWSIPTMALAAAAPAVAASCTPTTVNNSAAVTWTGEQTSVTGDDPEYYTVTYTFTNSGPDVLPANAEVDLTLDFDMFTGEETDLKVTGTSSNVSTVVTSATPADNGDGTSHYQYKVAITTTAAVAVNGVYTVTVQATIGALKDPPHVDEKVTAVSPLSETVGCITTITVVTTSGSANDYVG